MVLLVNEADVARLTDGDLYLSGAVEALDKGFRDYANGEIISSTPSGRARQRGWPRVSWRGLTRTSWV